MTPTVRINSRRIFIAAVVISLLLAAGSLTTQFMRVIGGMQEVPLDHLLNVDSEGNLPTCFSTMLLALAAALLYVIGSARRSEKSPDGRYWLALSGIFLYLSIDEAAHLHEMGRSIPQSIVPDWGGIFHRRWVVAAIPAVAVVCIVFFRFVMRLPKETRRLLLISATMFVGGALGLELVAGVLKHAGVAKPWRIVGETVEELCEMNGAILFNYALLRYIANHLPGIHLNVDTPPEQP